MNEQTSLIHHIPVDELTGAISVPIYQTSTFVQEAPGVNKGFDYARTNNPTRLVLEKLIAHLEGGETGIAFASGLAAIDAVLKLLQSGDEIIAVDDIYGGAFRLFTHVYEKFGVKVHYCDTTRVENVLLNLTSKTKLIWIESPTNPTLKISDLAAIAHIAHENNILLCVDNTFASPVLQKPINFGADIVIHSATKYLGGHSDLIAGLVVTKTSELGEKIKFLQNASGNILGPFDSWLVIRGIETIYIRMQRQCETAIKVARWLEKQDFVKQVYYPGLKSHFNHQIAAKQMKEFGAIVSLVLKSDSEESAKKFVTGTDLFKLAESLGGIKSLICHPAAMTHKSIPIEKRHAGGVADSLIRLSIGLEDADDLIMDLTRASNKLNNNHSISGESLKFNTSGINLK